MKVHITSDIELYQVRVEGCGTRTSRLIDPAEAVQLGYIIIKDQTIEIRSSLASLYLRPKADQ